MGWRSRLLRHSDGEVRPVIEKRLEAGAVLCRAGEPCSGVALIHEGEVALFLDDGGTPLQVGTLGKGACVGSDAVLGSGLCRHTVVAVRRTTVEMLARDVFLERRAAGGEAAAIRAAPPPQPAAAVLLAPGSAELACVVPTRGTLIEAFPFVVGRAAGTPDDAGDHCLRLADQRPYRLSRRHFLIVATADGIALSDPGSRLGTLVDGEPLGLPPRLLRPGRPTEVLAGGPRSPFRFQLTVLGAA